jgi:predicted nucleic acid-binding protein
VRVALDTNILVYAEGVNGAPTQALAVELIRRLPPDNIVLPVQTLGELFNVLVRKAGRSRTAGRDAILKWYDGYAVIETSGAVMLAAAGLAADHRLSIWDSVILAAAAQAGCRLLLSEDLQNGFTWGGVTVTNPFLTPRHPLLEGLIAGPPQ